MMLENASEGETPRLQSGKMNLQQNLQHFYATNGPPFPIKPPNS